MNVRESLGANESVSECTSEWKREKERKEMEERGNRHGSGIETKNRNSAIFNDPEQELERGMILIMMIHNVLQCIFWEK